MASLNPNTSVLGTVFARHLLRRASFVYSKTIIDQFSALTPSQALDLLLVNEPPILPLLQYNWCSFQRQFVALYQ